VVSVVSVQHIFKKYPKIYFLTKSNIKTIVLGIGLLGPAKPNIERKIYAK